VKVQIFKFYLERFDLGSIPKLGIGLSQEKHMRSPTYAFGEWL